MWFDLGEAYKVRHCYTHAAHAVREAGDTGLGAYVSGYQAMVANHTAQPEVALRHLDEATETTADTLTGMTRSWLTIQRAETLAQLGRRAEALHAIGHAHELHTRPRPWGADPWMYSFDDTSLAAHTGHCYLALDQPIPAAEAFEYALGHRPESCDRRAAKIKVGLARARLAGGDGDDALRLAAEALDTFTGRGSIPGVRAVAGLRTAFRQHGMPGAAAALDDHARAAASVEDQ